MSKILVNLTDRTLVVDGTDISKSVSELHLSVVGREMPRLGVVLAPDATIELEGAVEVIRDFDPLQAIREFLEAIDPKQLSDQALASLSMDDDPVVAIIETMKGYLDAGG